MSKNIINLSIMSNDRMLFCLYKEYFEPHIRTSELGHNLDFKEDFILIDLDTNHYLAMDLIWQFRRFNNPHSKLIIISYFMPMPDITINMLITHYGISRYFFKNHTMVSSIKAYMIENR